MVCYNCRDFILGVIRMKSRILLAALSLAFVSNVQAMNIQQQFVVGGAFTTLIQVEESQKK